MAYNANASNFEAEYTATIHSTGHQVRVEKVGGGTVGRTYSGAWSFEIDDPQGTLIASGYGTLITGLPNTHSQVATLAWKLHLAAQRAARGDAS